MEPRATSEHHSEHHSPHLRAQAESGKGMGNSLWISRSCPDPIAQNVFPKGIKPKSKWFYLSPNIQVVKNLFLNRVLALKQKLAKGRSSPFSVWECQTKRPGISFPGRQDVSHPGGWAPWRTSCFRILPAPQFLEFLQDALCLGKVKSPALQLSTFTCSVLLTVFLVCSESCIHLVPAGLFVNQGFKWSRKKCSLRRLLFSKQWNWSLITTALPEQRNDRVRGEVGTHTKCPVWRHTAKYLQIFCELLCWHSIDILCAWGLPEMTMLRRGRPQCPPCLNLISNTRCDSATVSHRHNPY